MNYLGKTCYPKMPNTKAGHAALLLKHLSSQDNFELNPARQLQVGLQIRSCQYSLIQLFSSHANY